MDLRHLKVLITGGSKGIGRETARQLRDAGAAVMITGRDLTTLKASAAELDSPFFEGDVSDEKSVKEMIPAAVKQLGGLNAVINNAAAGYFAPIHEIESEKFERLFRTNVFGAMYVGRESAKHFISQKAGTIINISSSAGVHGFAGGTAYAASKFALKGMTECWRAELRQHNIRVMLVNPSEVQTNFGGRHERPKDSINPSKLVASDIAQTIVAMLALPERAFITETSVWATNPK